MANGSVGDETPGTSVPDESTDEDAPRRTRTFDSVRPITRASACATDARRRSRRTALGVRMVEG
jgi:hypothetical protein